MNNAGLMKAEGDMGGNSVHRRRMFRGGGKHGGGETQSAREPALHANRGGETPADYSQRET